MTSKKLQELVNHLWVDTADVKPVNYDFSEHPYGEDWDVAISRTEHEVENGDFEPMMNYRYPLPDFKEKHLSDEHIRKALEHANVTLLFDLKSEEHFLALTGGGMDISWDIVEAYAKLGFTPPAHFCRDLPNYAGQRLTEDKKLALLACRKSLTAQSGWNKSGLDKLDYLEKEMRENSRTGRTSKKLGV